MALFEHTKKESLLLSFFKIIIIIYLGAPGLSCGVWDLVL